MSPSSEDQVMSDIVRDHPSELPPPHSPNREVPSASSSRLAALSRSAAAHEPTGHLPELNDAPRAHSLARNAAHSDPKPSAAGGRQPRAAHLVRGSNERGARPRGAGEDDDFVLVDELERAVDEDPRTRATAPSTAVPLPADRSDPVPSESADPAGVPSRTYRAASGGSASATATTTTTYDDSDEVPEDDDGPADPPAEKRSYLAIAAAALLGPARTVAATERRPIPRQPVSAFSRRVQTLFENHTREQVVVELDRRGEDNLRLGQEIEYLQRRAREGEQALLAQLEAAEQRARELAQELAESRAFVEADDVGDVAGVIKGLNDVSAALDDLAFQMSEALAGAKSEVQMRSQHVDRLLQPSDFWQDYSRTLARTCVREKKTIQDFVCLAVPSALISILHSQIFAPFKIELVEETDRVLRELYAQIQRSEPQDRAGRWRSITYEGAYPSSPSSDRAFCSHLASWTITYLVRLLSPLLPSLDSSECTLQVSLARWEPDLCEVMMKALAWRARTSRGFLSLDFVPKIVPSQEASRIAEEQKKGQKVVAIAGFGLVQRKSVAIPGGKTGEEGVRLEESWLEQTPVRWETDLEEEE